jgi:hypothetical protein
MLDHIWGKSTSSHLGAFPQVASEQQEWDLPVPVFYYFWILDSVAFLEMQFHQVRALSPSPQANLSVLLFKKIVVNNAPIYLFNSELFIA